MAAPAALAPLAAAHTLVGHAGGVLGGPWGRVGVPWGEAPLAHQEAEVPWDQHLGVGAPLGHQVAARMHLVADQAAPAAAAASVAGLMVGPCCSCRRCWCCWGLAPAAAAAGRMAAAAAAAALVAHCTAPLPSVVQAGRRTELAQMLQEAAVERRVLQEEGRPCVGLVAQQEQQVPTAALLLQLLLLGVRKAVQLAPLALLLQGVLLQGLLVRKQRQAQTPLLTSLTEGSQAACALPLLLPLLWSTAWPAWPVPPTAPACPSVTAHLAPPPSLPGPHW